MKPIKLFKRIPSLIVLISTILLSSCSQETVKPTTNKHKPEVKQSASKLEREKYRSAITALNSNDLSKAQRLLNEFIRNKPDLAGGYSNLALVHFKKNELDKSLVQVNKALKLNPKQVQALNLRAQLYVKNGKIHEAKDDYILAVTTKPDYANAQYNLALLYDIYLQDINHAIKHYKKYLSLLKKPDVTTKEWVTHLEGTLRNE